MRLPLIIASILCSLTFSDAAYSSQLKKKPTSSRKLGLVIKVEGGGWGNVSRETIETVLYSVADELLSRLPKKLDAPIVVTHTDSNPVVLYERGSKGEYQVHLHASEKNWHLYTYEFAHELCHILSNYEENTGPGGSKYNQWFEETLCETASLFTLKNLAATWKNSPPAPEWSATADKLNRFFDLLVSEGHRRLPPHSPLAAWLRDNEERLRHFDVCGPAGSGACLAFHGDTIRRGATSSKWFNKKVDGRGQCWAFNQDADGVGVRIVFALGVGRAP
jgi:hypothetical protein